MPPRNVSRQVSGGVNPRDALLRLSSSRVWPVGSVPPLVNPGEKAELRLTGAHAT